MRLFIFSLIITSQLFATDFREIYHCESKFNLESTETTTFQYTPPGYTQWLTRVEKGSISLTGFRCIHKGINCNPIDLVKYNEEMLRLLDISEGKIARATIKRDRSIRIYGEENFHKGIVNKYIILRPGERRYFQDVLYACK